MTRFIRDYSKLVEMIWRKGDEVEVGQWQSQDVSDRPEMISRELRHITFTLDVPESLGVLQDQVRPNLPWAEDHFQERVSGIPYNPPPSEAYWPYAVRGNSDHKEGEKFSHTYPERLWPKEVGWAKGDFEYWTKDLNRGLGHSSPYPLGDLDDVIELLAKNPLTRQAYIPIWFPQDTGARLGQRVPCTLGYHVLIRRGKAELVYHIRSCDLLRHFTDDVYMAARLLQWIVGRLQERNIEVTTDKLIMHIASLHIFRGDYPRIQLMLADMEDEDTYGAAI